MTHGKKQQEVCQNKKNKKSMTGLRTMLLILMILMLITKAFMIIIEAKNTNKTTNLYDLLLDKQVMTVKNESDIDYQDDGVSFNLKTKEYFSLKSAVKDGRVYGYRSKDSKIAYTKTWKRYFFEEYRNFKTSKSEIKQSNFLVTKNVTSLTKDKNTDFYHYTNNPDYHFSKIRVTFNTDYLPIKVEWYYKPLDEPLTGQSFPVSWYTVKEFSYPYKNKQDFNKALDEAIEWIKISESEMEEEE